MQNTAEKVKNQREKSKFWGKTQNSGGKLKILGEKSKYRRKSKIPRKKHFFLLKFQPDELPHSKLAKALNSSGKTCCSL